uniref:Pacifastin domain-containing protein n=2 Tax=Bombyx mori TaxID=7091 RepID=A0A8R2DKP5_BOMMO|nr:uncharacterized protein LOC110385413 [Bombyx mori]
MAVCTNRNNACKPNLESQNILNLEDVRQPFSRSQVAKLPTLRSRQVACTPGRAYRVDCNACVCLASGNLLCDKLLCLSYSEMHRIDARKLSGKACKTDAMAKPENECVTCECEGKKTQCTEIEGCVTRAEKSTWINGQPQLTLDLYKDKCLPGGVYIHDCNHCYCQEDLSLRCTQRTCLNYSESKALEELRLRLIQEGL